MMHLHHKCSSWRNRLMECHPIQQEPVKIGFKQFRWFVTAISQIYYLFCCKTLDFSILCVNFYSWFFYLACRHCPPFPIPNTMEAASPANMAPYFVGETITRVCISGFEPVPSNAVLTCTCNMDPSPATTVSWSCSPMSSTVCQPSKCLLQWSSLYVGWKYFACFYFLYNGISLHSNLFIKIINKARGDFE